MTMIPVLHAGDHKKEEELGVQDTFKERRSRIEEPSGEWAGIVMGLEQNSKVDRMTDGKT